MAIFLEILNEKFPFRLGLDKKVLAGIINTSSGRCWSSELYNPVPGVVENIPPSKDYEGGFGAALMTKVSNCIKK
jgi:3-hydroxyisobutyrate dehydrogenase